MEQEQQKPWLSGRRRNLVGVLLIILPFITLVGVIFLYAITSFIIDSVVGASVAHAQEFTDLDAQRVLDDPMYQSGIAPEIPISAYQGMEEEFDGFGTMNALTAESGGLEEVSRDGYRKPYPYCPWPNRDRCAPNDPDWRYYWSLSSCH